MKADHINTIDLTTEFGVETLMAELYDNRFFTAKDLNISSRTISYWKETQVLTWFPPFKTGRYSFMEAAWLCVLKFLQKAGLSIELMKKLTVKYIDEPFRQNLAEKLIKNELRQLKIKGEEKSLRAVRLKECLNSRTDMEKLRREMNDFTGLIQKAIRTRQPCGIIINQSGEPATYDGSTFNEKENLVHLLSQFHIVIPLMPILTELISIEFDKNNFDFPLLTPDEKLVLREIRREDVNSLIIDKNKMKLTIKVTKEGEINSRQLAEKIMNGSLNGWDGISVSNRNKDTWYIKRTKKIVK